MSEKWGIEGFPLQIPMDFHKTKLANELYDLGNIYLPFYFHQKGSETTGI